MRCAKGRCATLLASLALLSLFTTTSTVATRANSEGAQQKEQPKVQDDKKKKPDEEKSDDDTVLKLNTDLVILDVNVLDPNNQPVMDLKQDQFAVTEDKQPQKIEFFSRDEVPVSVVLAIDTSGSMRAKIDSVIKACSSLVKESRKSDEIAVVEFKDQPELLTEFTTDINDVVDTLNGLIASRQTAMLDALYLGADYANKEGKNRRKAVLVVTDGLDKDSYYKFDEVVDHLRELDVQVYLVGFTNDLSKEKGLFKSSEKGKAESLLNKLASETGGKAFFPTELAQIHDIAKQISIDLRTQYSIGYYPTNTSRDGTFRAVKVQVNAPNRKLVARTRNGYTAPKDGSAASVPKN